MKNQTQDQLQEKAIIRIQQLELHLHLGWPKNEREQKQTVLMDATIQFATKPLACETDKLEDTFCYHALIQTIEKNISARTFRLIEHLGHEIYQIMKQALPEGTLIQIAITKKPAIANLKGGVVFCYGS